MVYVLDMYIVYNLVLDGINAFMRSHLIQKIFYDFQSIKEGKIK